MIKFLLVVALLCIAIRWATGAWPWQWLRTAAPRQADLARARRLLIVPPSAGREEISAAYRRLAAEMHPDRGGSTARLAALTEARDLLLSHLPETRP